MRAVLVICEGQHDTLFATRSLGVHAGCEFKGWGDRKLRELPSPFGAEDPFIPHGVIIESFKQRSMDSFSAAIRDPIPLFERAVYSESADTLYLLVRANGDQQAKAVIKFLGTLDDLIELATGITEYAVAFIFDADQDGEAARVQQFQQEYREHFGPMQGLKHAGWVASKTVPVGIFVYPGVQSLEGHLGPMLQSAWPTIMPKAQAFIDGHRAEEDWSTSKRWKAVITAAGQFEKPGSPMSSMLSRDMISRESFQSNPMSEALARFLAAKTCP